MVMDLKSLQIKNDESDTDVDEDIWNEEEINTLFPSCKLIASESLGNNYILHLDGTLEHTPNISACLSNNTCVVYHCSNNRFAKETELQFESCVTGAKFSRENHNLLFTSTHLDGVQLWDLRTSKVAVKTFVDAKEETNKTKTTFDISCNNVLLAAGTELHLGDAFIIFWDIRNEKLLGGYWESHTDDITSIAFHPTDCNKLASGSTDGLINLYDLSQSNEDDALTDTFNTESSIDQLLWHTKNSLCSITHTSDIQMWNAQTGNISSNFTRSELADANKRKCANFCYVANAHITKNDELFTLIGSNFNEGECVRSLKVVKKNLIPFFALNGNKQRIRSSWFNPHVYMLMSGGEKGILNMWNLY